MINKLILVGISIVIGISMIVVLVNISDDIKDNITTNVEVVFAENVFYDPNILSQNHDFLWDNFDYITDIYVGGIEFDFFIDDYTIEGLLHDGVGYTYLFILEPSDYETYGSQFIFDPNDIVDELLGDGLFIITFAIPSENILTTLIDLLPIISTLILITTAVIVIKKQN